MLLCQTESCFLVYGPVFTDDLLIDFNIVLTLLFFFWVFWRKLLTVESSGEQLALHIELQEMQKKKREKEEETRQHTIFESSD